MRERRFCIVGLLVLLVAWPASAASRVALLRVETGRVSLDGRVVSTPQLLEEGARVVLEKGARARVQLLEGQGEISIVGPKKITVSPSFLKKARPVKRAALAAVPDIGNTTRGAANTTREAKRQLRGLSIPAEPVWREGSWVFPVQTTPLFFEPQRKAEWVLSRVELSPTSGQDSSEHPLFKAQVLATGHCAGTEQEIAVRGDLLEPGQRYLMAVRVESPDLWDILTSYQPFRLLTEEETEVLQTLESEAMERSQKNGTVLPLLELSTLLMEWDQMADAERVLKHARTLPGWNKLDEKTVEKVENFQKVIDEVWDRPVKSEKKS